MNSYLNHRSFLSTFHLLIWLFYFSQTEMWSLLNFRSVSMRKQTRSVVRAEMFGQLTSGLEAAWNKLKGEGFFFFLLFHVSPCNTVSFSYLFPYVLFLMLQTREWGMLILSCNSRNGFACHCQLMTKVVCWFK